MLAVNCGLVVVGKAPVWGSEPGPVVVVVGTGTVLVGPVGARVVEVA
jgi:hypothetical protein